MGVGFGRAPFGTSPFGSPPPPPVARDITFTVRGPVGHVARVGGPHINPLHLTGPRS